MAVSGVRGDIVSLVRNHECSIDEGPLLDLPASATYAPSEHGGNTNIYFNVATGEWVESYGSLAGTIRNCAGGSTPWVSWISCEETFQVAKDGLEHGKTAIFLSELRRYTELKLTFLVPRQVLSLMSLHLD